MGNKKLFISLFLLIFPLVNNHAIGRQSLIVELRDGSKTAFLLSEKPEMTFSDFVLTISMNNNKSIFEITNVRQFFFDQETTNIEKGSKDTKVVFQSDDKIVIGDIGVKDIIRLYSINGTQYPRCITINGNQAEILLGSLPKGTYIIKISNNQSFKIYKK